MEKRIGFGRPRKDESLATKEENEFIALINKGYTLKEVAEECNYSFHKAKKLLEEVRKKRTTTKRVTYKIT